MTMSSYQGLLVRIKKKKKKKQAANRELIVDVQRVFVLLFIY